ncbi:MAG: MurT ligase domain-containing protein [Bacilli bacterium]|jgi:uncharacterized metal-binding protein (TIGR02443 family)
MRMKIAILIGKILCFIGKKMNRGSSFPGKIVNLIYPNILPHIKLPKLTIAVTASCGKTSTAAAVAHILKSNGYTVGHNIESNLLFGIITLMVDNCNLNGQITKDAIVMEVDERYTKNIFKILKPNYLIINNITRDQPPRHGHYQVVWNDIRSSFDDSVHLILNIDDSIVHQFSFNHKGPVTYFGLGKNALSYHKPISNNLDITYCPKCHSKLKFNYFQYGNIGHYECPKCDFKRHKPDFEATKINLNKAYFMINDKHKINIQNDVIYYIYNVLAAFALGSALGIDQNKLSIQLNELSLAQKRFERLSINNRECLLLSSKNENCTSYNQSMLYISRQKEKKTLLFGFYRISYRYPHKDLSWLWDIDFELLKDNNIDKIVCVGDFAYDLANRLAYCDFKDKDIIICQTIEEAISILQNKTKGKIYAVLNSDTEKEFKKIVKQVTIR